MKGNAIAEVLLLVVLGLVLSGCSNTLTRSKAQELIIKRYGVETVSPVPKHYILAVRGDAIYDNDCIARWSQEPNEYSDAKDSLETLLSKQLIAVAERKEEKDNCRYWWKDATLTTDGNKYLTSETKDQYNVKIADLSFEVTGMKVNEANKSAVAYFIRRSTLTPFALAYPKQITENMEMTFSQFDDGWRVDR